MAYKTLKVLTEKLSKATPQVSLPREGVIEEIILRITATFKNSGGTDANVTYEDLLKAFKAIRVISDGSNVHYALGGVDIAIMNYYDHAGKGEYLGTNVTIPAGGTTTLEFLLKLDAGAIHGLIHQSLMIEWVVEDPPVTNVTTETAEAEVSVRQEIFESVEEYMRMYGSKGERIAEPKVYVIEADLSATNDLRKVLELPVGTLLWRGILVVKDSADARSDSVVSQYALVVNRPQRIELYRVSWATAQKLDKMQYNVIPLAGVSIFDFSKEIGGIGILGWKYSKGDITLDAVSSDTGKLRYISFELVVNPEAFK